MSVTNKEFRFVDNLVAYSNATHWEIKLQAMYTQLCMYVCMYTSCIIGSTIWYVMFAVIIALP